MTGFGGTGVQVSTEEKAVTIKPVSSRMFVVEILL
jgi:hypothetical protein